ncbi:thioredoxin [Streptococcus sp. ZJ93]|uniref:thioredoxin n=1 Tax=Streptococcus handemini TaxID=3161188 RepID=UPI0032EB3746
MTKQLTTETFAKEIESGVTLVDFGATWCPPCQMMEPIVEELAQEFEGRASVTKVDVDQSPELAQLFNVRSIPTIVLFKDGQPVDATLGVQSKKVLSEKISSQL